MTPVTHTPDHGPVHVEVAIAWGPDARPRVLIQLPPPLSYVLTDAAGARALAAGLLATADELDEVAP